MVKRTTCLYCEEKGVVSELVFDQRGGHCPIHSAGWLSQHVPSVAEALLRAGVDTRESIAREQKRIADLARYRAEQEQGG